METGTLTDRVYEAIKHKILSGEFSDGERLNLTHLAKELNVSNTPLREAINRLEKVGLIKVVPYRGPYVRTLSPLEVAEIYDVRIALEMLAARLVAATVTPGTLEEIESAYRRYEQACEQGEEDRITETDIDFHEVIARSTNNQTLIDLLQMLSDWTRLFIQVMERNKSPAVLTRGHLRILEAIRAGNKEEAAVEMRRHLLNGKQNVINRLAEQLDKAETGESPLNYPNAW